MSLKIIKFKNGKLESSKKVSIFDAVEFVSSHKELFWEFSGESNNRNQTIVMYSEWGKKWTSDTCYVITTKKLKDVTEYLCKNTASRFILASKGSVESNNV